ncbi:hypothetical protein DKX38_006378 [Salix brachista]|uniref:Uncharacterized protein n=1 Tax=Salix brachista TaxID=2182728 RepID=A0A5N5N4N0_9ROSI|nr:hypothetical protein DKX38_006378 [Salix brachista]
MSIPKTVDSTLWSDSFTAILTDLENAPLTSFLTSRKDIKHPVKSKLVKQMDWNGDLFVATVNLLTAAAHKQACFNRQESQVYPCFRIFLLDFPPVEDREVATSLFIVHVMGKLVTGDAGSLSIPEMPMPEILHGLQLNVPTALVLSSSSVLSLKGCRRFEIMKLRDYFCNSDCWMRRLLLFRNSDSNKSKYINPEIQSVCLLLLQIMEMVLYLELVALQICGISPVLGR